jgi:ubiquinone/menaquinone biosynthesis C-methylase UbiE
MLGQVPIGTTEDQIAGFWEAHPCGDQLVAGSLDDYAEFFSTYDSFRYRTEAHIIRCLDALDLAGKKTLEIGLGQGADSEQLIRRGAVWSGLDLTRESVSRVRLRMQSRDLLYEAIKQGSVLDIPYASGSFDLVYSHGVLHHVPDIMQAQNEIRRVLKPEGTLVVMLYAKYSLNYLISICLLRRLGILIVVSKKNASGIYAKHRAKARQQGLIRYLRINNFIHYNTDGPDNPYSKVYTTAEVRQDFPAFKIIRAHKEFMHAPPIPIHGWPGSSLLGWHLWVHMVPR